MKSSVNFYQHVSFHINALKFLGLWVYIEHPVNSLWFWFGVFNRIIVGMLAFVISTGGQLVYLIRLILSGNSNILEVTGILNLVCTELLAEFRLLDMRLRREQLSNTLKNMNNEEFKCHSQPERKICERAIKISRILFVVLLFGASVDVFVHVVVVPSLQRFESLPLKMDLIFIDVNDQKYYKYVCVYQILYKPYMLVAFIAFQTMPWAAMLFAMGQLDILIYNFENMKELVKYTSAERNCDENEAFRQIFRKLVLHHSSIIRFIKSLQTTFGPLMSGYLFVSASVMGTTALQFFSIESPLKHFSDVFWLLAYVVIFVAILYIDCYFGNCITYKCAQISTCVYSTQWLNLDNAFKKVVIIFIAKTQQPVIITTVKVMPVSLETFTKVMNWTYKGFAIMNQMN